MIIGEKLRVLQNKIGSTPLVPLRGGVCAKLESANPAGSIKDRAALYMLMRALESGALREDGRVVEATSGNTGIGLAYISRELGLKCCIVMPESMSAQRREMLASYGAELVLTPADKGMLGAVRKAKELAMKGAYYTNQFCNKACVEAHYLTTAQEIFLSAPRTECIVVGVGSGGTAMGIKKYIEDNSIGCRVIGVEPAASPLLTRGRVGGHKIQGIGANFIPKILDVARLDGIIDVSDEAAITYTRKLWQEYGLRCGISSGAAYCAALRLAHQGCESIVAILPDSGDRYADSLYI